MIYVVHFLNMFLCKGFGYTELSTNIAHIPFMECTFLTCLLEKSWALKNKVQTLQSFQLVT